jgi:trehalose-6-phosphate synthase
MSISGSALIVVSNRLPFTLVKEKDGTVRRKAAAGGLGTAVAPVVVESKGIKFKRGRYHR